MKKEIIYPGVESANHTSEAVDMLALGCLLTGFGAPIALGLMLASDAHCESEAENAHKAQAVSEEEADSIADTWRRNRSDGETHLQVKVEVEEGEVIYAYSVETDD